MAEADAGWGAKDDESPEVEGRATEAWEAYVAVESVAAVGASWAEGTKPSTSEVLSLETVVTFGLSFSGPRFPDFLFFLVFTKAEYFLPKSAISVLLVKEANRSEMERSASI